MNDCFCFIVIFLIVSICSQVYWLSIDYLVVAKSAVVSSNHFVLQFFCLILHFVPSLAGIPMTMFDKNVYSS